MTAVLAMVSIGAFLYFPAALKRQAIEGVAQKAATVADMAAFSIAPALWSRDRVALAEALTGLRRNPDLVYFVLRDGSGQVFGSSTGFNLPNGATRSPDVAWVRNERLDALTDEQWQRFLPLCPDFVLELRSPSDSMGALHKKMEEYRENGARLGWLLDPASKQVHSYRPGTAVEMVNDPATLSGEPLLRGFVLDVPQIWAVMERKR